jgi:hypothetical protein
MTRKEKELFNLAVMSSSSWKQPTKLLKLQKRQITKIILKNLQMMIIKGLSKLISDQLDIKRKRYMELIWRFSQN